AAANKALIKELNSRKGVKLNIANSVWADPTRMTFNANYLKDVEDNFDSAARTLDFSDPESVNVINGWISDKTNKLIPEMLAKIEPDMVAMLINAIYFKGDWTDPFDKADTKAANWKLASGGTKEIDLMSRYEGMVYGEIDGVQ